MKTRLRLAGEEHRRLAGGVAAADDGDVGAAALLHLVRRRGVEDAAALEARASLDLEPAIVGAGGNHHRLGDDRLAAVERDRPSSRR